MIADTFLRVSYFDRYDVILMVESIYRLICPPIASQLNLVGGNLVREIHQRLTAAESIER